MISSNMKCTIPEISWHNRDPVLSVDIQSNTNENDFYRLASGGTDSHVLIWYMSINKTGSVNLDLAADLTRHQRAVNVVKWSPNGEYLASGDDETVIYIWKQKGENELLNIVDTTNEQDKEIWLTQKILRGHMEDVYDLCWSPNSKFLVSGSVDNTAIIWDIEKGKSVCILNDHKSFVQGVAWDPLNQYIATLSTDRYLRIFDIQTKKVISRNNKCTLPVPEGHELHGKTIRLYHDDTLQTFFRRLCFSPDGKLLIVPSGVTDYDGCTKPLHTTYIYSRYSLKQPAIILPSLDQYTVAVKCCPTLFKLQPYTNSNNPVIPLPYRIIFAVATKSSVYLYDTQQKMPFGLISNIHYTRLTDLTWSMDGKILVVSSTDGFCSLITFSDGELGEKYEENDPITVDMKQKESDTNKKIENITNDVDMEEISNEELEKKVSSTNKEHKTFIENKPEQIKQKQCIPTPIETRKTPRKINHDDNTETKLSDTAIILDKNIISTTEKFETPEKKDHPATPISIRRHPRNINSPAVSTSILNTTNSVINFKENVGSGETEMTPKKSEQKQIETQKVRSSKKATPIAIRRQPRVLVTTNPVEATTITEEAIDSWPSNAVTTVKVQEEVESKKMLENGITTNKQSKCLIVAEITAKTDIKEIESQNIEHTEDIRLVYEETQEENESKQTKIEENQN